MKMAQTYMLCTTLVLLCGCDRSAVLDTPSGEAWCGNITLGGAYRSGFSPRVQLRLHIDASLLDSDRSPGRVTTFDSGEQDHPKLLDNAPLRPMRALAHDPLSQLQIGQGRELNYLFATTPTPATHESLLAIVSLRNDDQVEVRLLRPGAAAAADDPLRRPLFGVFLLQRRSDNCGFE